MKQYVRETQMKTQMKTERLEIRLIHENDWRSIQAIWRDFQKSEYSVLDTAKDTGDEAMKTRIAKWADAMKAGKEHLFYAVCREHDVIGYLALNIRAEGYELAYGFLQKEQGRGYATESLTAVLAAMKEAGVEKIIARTALQNSPSVRLLRGLQFEQTGTEQLSFHQDANGNEIWFTGGIFERML